MITKTGTVTVTAESIEVSGFEFTGVGYDEAVLEALRYVMGRTTTPPEKIVYSHGCAYCGKQGLAWVCYLERWYLLEVTGHVHICENG